MTPGVPISVNPWLLHTGLHDSDLAIRKSHCRQVWPKPTSLPCPSSHLQL